MRSLTFNEMSNHVVGEAITVTTVMGVLLAAVMAIVIYRLFMSTKGAVNIPGGWKFTWS